MNTLLFGSRYTDFWELSFDDVSVPEGVIAITGELKAGFLAAATPMCWAPSVVREFAEQVRLMDRTLKGDAKLESKSNQSEVTWTLSLNRLGHVESGGRYSINGNSFDFRFKTDQTRLAPLVEWLDGLIAKYEADKNA